MQSTLPDFLLEKELKGIRWFSVPFLEIQKNNFRMDSGAFATEARLAKELLKKCRWDLVPIYGEKGICEAFHRPRFRRIILSKSEFPIYQPSQILEINPKPQLFISKKTDVDIDSLRVRRNQILMTCSGTVGEVTFVSKTLQNKIFSHDLLRITSKDENDAGFVYAFLKSKIGKLLVQNNNYGAVISHIEPEHLENIYIPYPSVDLRKQIHSLIVESFNLRDESNDLIDKAHGLLKKELSLPDIDEMKPKYFSGKFPGLRNFSISFSELNNRFDGSYHVPIVKTILKYLQTSSREIITLDNQQISHRIFIPTRFKRVYVEEKHGITYFSGKHVLHLDPADKKYLAYERHNKKIKELTIEENMILITCSGIVGKTMIVPKHWDGWVMTHDIIRIMPQQEFAGYIYAWLSSVYGQEIIKRYSYGAVVNHIEAEHISKVQIPLLKNKDVQKQINDLILEANKKRYLAYLKEQEALKKLDEEVLN